jgi:predicted metal-binding membrane protein
VSVILNIRSLLWIAFFAAILLAWMMIFMMATDMDVDLIGRPGEMGAVMATMDPTMPMDMPMARFGPLFAMWAIMMAAMMLPTMVPTLRSYEDLMVSANGSRAGWIGVLLGYFIVWVAFAALITSVQLGLLFGGVVDMLGIAKSVWVSAGLLIVVGAYQFTRLKEICHGVCHSPMMYFVGHWKTGFGGGLRMGLGLGGFCVVCCWGFMALGFVGGVMSLLWMGLATLFMILEKLPAVGHLVTKPMGVVLILAGIALPVWAHI